MKTAAVLSAIMGGAAAFQAPMTSRAQTSLAAKSEAVPFLEKPDCLDGKLAGDVGFDPLKLSEIDFDWSKLVVPFWTEERAGLSTLYWMREAELKHGRVAMLATLGYVAVDMGMRFPGTSYLGHSAVSAHDDFVSSGNMGVMLLGIFVLELASGAALYDASKGSGRQAGDFAFDPLGFGKNPSKLATLQLKEVKNGRLAMLAFSGIITQAVLTGQGFPYLFDN
ncbi:unnamed protein product [Heterosigma akashiwo]|mmetsp:Transcript_23769/g.32875  ORF Transcript_23769/g.32875 Transcript_23769/m.32875 type:complete len:223 (+) Transcript_23769:88-756(+)